MWLSDVKFAERVPQLEIMSVMPITRRNVAGCQISSVLELECRGPLRE